MGVDDDWANWKPVQDSVAQGGSAFKARVALSSRGGSVSPDRRGSGPSSQAGRNAYNNKNSRNAGRDDRSATTRNPGPSPAKSADVAMRNFSRGDQQREPFNMRNGAANGTRDAPPPSSRPSSDANPDRRTRPRSPDLNRDRDGARRTEPDRKHNRDEDRRVGTPPPKPAREPEREDRSNRGKRDDRPRERSRSRDRSDGRDTRDKAKEKEQDRNRDGDSRRSKDDISRRDRDRGRDGDRRDSGRSDARRKDDDNYRSSDKKSDRDNGRKYRDDPSPRERPSRRDDDRDDRRSSLKRARTPERSEAGVEAKVQREETRDNGRSDRRRERRDSERNDHSERPDARDRRQDRKEEDTRQTKRMKEDTPPPKSARSDLSRTLEEPVLLKDVEMRSNTPPPRVVEQVPEPVEPEAVPEVEDTRAVEEEVSEAPIMDEPYFAEGYTQETLKKKPKILIRNLAPGTSHSDIQFFCSDYGLVLGVSSTDDPDNTESRIFEVSFNSMKDAEEAVRKIDNMQADGQILKANIIKNSGLRIKGADQTSKAAAIVETPTTAAPGSSSAASLLSRLSGPAPATTPTTANAKKAKAQANGSLPVDLLSPYTELLEKAGIRSLPALKKVLRPTSIPAYVEMLSDKYPNEELLSGLTAKWALRERLEGWLGEKKESRIDWGERPGR